MPELGIDVALLGGVVGQKRTGAASTKMINSWICDIAALVT